MAETEAALRTLAYNVRTARTRAGLSLDELGRRAKVSKGSLVALEKAQGNPNFATLAGWPTPSASRCPP
ncbi:Transcriptional regulator OS=Streptomyces antimycoticus OX=68175 GN=SSPO_079870 PE=4 SV=1 [Streptomyces antimycoticus]